MATVVSLTEDKIQELMSGWQSLGLSQDQINALVVQLKGTVETNDAQMQELNTTTLPQLQTDLAESSIRVSDLNDVTIPDLQNNLDQSKLAIENLQTVDIPALRQDVDSTIQNAIDRPKVYVQPEAPTNPDDDDRYLVVGDVWYDEDNNNKQTIWNGVEWSTFGVEISDFSLTVKKFMSSSHMIY